MPLDFEFFWDTVEASIVRLLNSISRTVCMVLFFSAICAILTFSIVTLIKDLTGNRDQLCLQREKMPVECGKTYDVLANQMGEKLSEAYNDMSEQNSEREQKYLSDNKISLMAKHDSNFWELKPAAKLTGTEFIINEAYVNGEMTSIPEWLNGRDVNDNMGFKQFGMRYRNGRLIVPVTGIYLVYSSVDYFEQCYSEFANADFKVKTIPMKHGIYKFCILDESDVEVISSVQTHNACSELGYNLYSSYVTSLVHLRAGDELSVKVNHLAYLKFPRENTFGINLL